MKGGGYFLDHYWGEKQAKSGRHWGRNRAQKSFHSGTHRATAGWGWGWGGEGAGAGWLAGSATANRYQSFSSWRRGIFLCYRSSSLSLPLSLSLFPSFSTHIYIFLYNGRSKWSRRGAFRSSAECDAVADTSLRPTGRTHCQDQWSAMACGEREKGRDKERERESKQQQRWKLVKERSVRFFFSSEEVRWGGGGG